MKNGLIIITVTFVSTTAAMVYGPAAPSQDTRLIPYASAHPDMKRLVDDHNHSRKKHHPDFFHREIVLLAFTNQRLRALQQHAHLAQHPLPISSISTPRSVITDLARAYQGAYQQQPGTIAYPDGSVGNIQDYETAVQLLDQAVTTDHTLQIVAHGNDYISRFLVNTRMPILAIGGVTTIAGIIYAATHPTTRMFAPPLEFSKLFYAVLVAGAYLFYKAKDVYQWTRIRWLTWTRSRVESRLDDVINRLEPQYATFAKQAKERDTQLAHRISELEQQEKEKERIIQLLSEKLETLKKQIEQNTQEHEESNTIMHHDLISMQQSVDELKKSGHNQQELLARIQQACSNVVQIATRIKTH